MTLSEKWFEVWQQDLEEARVQRFYGHQENMDRYSRAAAISHAAWLMAAAVEAVAHRSSRSW